MSMSAETGRHRWVPTTGVLVPIAVFVAIAVVVPSVANSYWLYVLTASLATVPVMQSLGVLSGRAGVLCLSQLSFAMIGAWVTGLCNLHGVPGGLMVWMLIAGLVAVPFGVLIGLSALRVRGVNLAVVTFAFAVAADVVFAPLVFPGYSANVYVARPAGFVSDRGYFLFTLAVVALLFVVLAVLDRARVGSAWLEVRYSERGAAAHGINVAWCKLSAFACGAFLAGLAGALMVGQAGAATAGTFVAQSSLFYFAIAVVIGVRYWHAAVLAAVVGSVMPVLLDLVGISQNVASLVFGATGFLVLAKGRGQLGQSEIIHTRRQAALARRLMAHAEAESGRETPAAVQARPEPAGAAASQAGTGTGDVSAAAAMPVPGLVATPPDAVLEVRKLAVQFGAVTAVRSVSLRILPGAVVAVIGPNGAGKSTLVNAITGFARYDGQVLLQGSSIDRLSAAQRSRRGVRRSFQQLRVPPTLSIERYLRLAAQRHLTREQVQEMVDWFALPPAQVQVGAVDVGTRRVIEVAGLAAGRPQVLLLDEPAAGQSGHDRRRLGESIAQIPARTGSSVVLVEHDMELVREVCTQVVVVDFGAVIADGSPAQVLSDPRVVDAYLGASTGIR